MVRAAVVCRRLSVFPANWPDHTTLKYQEPAPPMSGEEPKPVTTTVNEYDLSQLKASFKGVLMGLGTVAVMHIYFKYTNPLLIQSTSTHPPSLFYPATLT